MSQSVFNTSLSAEVKPDADVDDWEAIATDEEKGEFVYAVLIDLNRLKETFDLP